MKTDEIKRLYEWIQSRVSVGDGNPVAIVFAEPTAADFTDQGFEGDALHLTLRADWWPEMVTDIVETPEFAEPGETPEQILEYARDVVKEYVAKRLYT